MTLRTCCLENTYLFFFSSFIIISLTGFLEVLRFWLKLLYFFSFESFCCCCYSCCWLLECGGCLVSSKATTCCVCWGEKYAMTTIITTAATTTTTTTTIIIVTFTILLTTTNYFNRLTKQTNKRQHQKHASQFSCSCNFSCCFCINLKCNIFFNSLQCLFVCLSTAKEESAARVLWKLFSFSFYCNIFLARDSC